MILIVLFINSDIIKISMYTTKCSFFSKWLDIYNDYDSRYNRKVLRSLHEVLFRWSCSEGCNIYLSTIEDYTTYPQNKGKDTLLVRVVIICFPLNLVVYDQFISIGLVQSFYDKILLWYSDALVRYLLFQSTC